MKIRSGFVSNSSSASFVLRLENLTQEQELAIKSKIDDYLYIESIGLSQLYIKSDCWTVIFGDNKISGDTFMNNGGLEEWFQELGIPKTEYEIMED